MCGIAGSIGKNVKVSKFNIKQLNDTLYEVRFSKYLLNRDYFFYHSRLSISLRNISNQPMYSSDKRLLIVFNGEIYNYIELRKKIKNYKFKTKSDTEVILAAYKNWGKSFINKLSGAFSFLIYDFKKKETFFARDRFGQKPFFYSRVNSILIGLS